MWQEQLSLNHPLRVDLPELVGSRSRAARGQFMGKSFLRMKPTQSKAGPGDGREADHHGSGAGIRLNSSEGVLYYRSHKSFFFT